MSSLNSLNKFSTTNNNYFSTSNIDTMSHPNLYENKIKVSIPDYKNQKLNYLTNNYFQEPQTSNLNSSNYVDPFQLLENNKTFLLSNNNNDISQNANISDLQIKNMIEREMDPYLLKMKNELDMKFNQFLEEMDSKKELFNEINSMKNLLTEYQKQNEINQKNLDKKLFKITSELNGKQRKLDEIENNIFNMNNSHNNISKQNEDINNNLNEITKIKNKLSTFDNINEKITQEISDNIEKISTMKTNQLINEVKILKEDNNSIKTNLSKLNMNIDNINIENTEKDKLIQNISDNNNMFLNDINDIKINNNQLQNKFDKYDTKNNELEKKIKSLNDKYNNLNANINSISINITQLKENIHNLNSTIFDLDTKTNNIKTINQNITNKFTLIESSIDSNKIKISNLKNIIDTTVNKNSSIMYKDLSDQMSKCKSNIEEFHEIYDSKISEVSKNLNEIKLKIENNPFMQMSNNQRLSQAFKKEVIDANETFKEQIETIMKEISKLQIDRKNFIEVDKNFKKIDTQLGKIKSLEKNAKKYPEIFQTLSDKHKGLKEEVQKCFDENTKCQNETNKAFTKAIENLRLELNNFIKKSKLDMSYGNNNVKQNPPMQMINKETTNQINDLNLNVKKLRNDCNENINDIKQLKLNIKEINENKIPDIYKMLNNIKISNLSIIEPVKNEKKNEFNPINNNINNNVNSNINNNVTNNNIINNVNNNVNNNVINNVNNSINSINSNVNNEDKIQDYEQLAKQIELMDEKNDNDNNKKNENKEDDNIVNSNNFENKANVDNFDEKLNSNLDVKGNDIDKISKHDSRDYTDDLIDKIMKGENLNNSNNKNINADAKENEIKSGFVDDFDDDDL